MNLYYEQAGHGPVLVLIHGWGLNHHVWSALLPQFSKTQHVMAVDLPGHGKSEMLEGGTFSLENVAAAVAQTVPQDSIVLGWSLGGLIAQQIALRHPGLIKGLILVASSARFSHAQDWPYGMSTELLAGFADQLTRDYQGTVQRFLAVQSMGSIHARDEIRYLREALKKENEPHPDALCGGLRLLQECDLREQLKQIDCPVLIINGERDRLVMPQTGKAMAQAIPHAKQVMIKGSGHAPFLSHRATFIELVEHFIHGS